MKNLLRGKVQIKQLACFCTKITHPDNSHDNKRVKSGGYGIKH